MWNSLAAHGERLTLLSNGVDTGNMACFAIGLIDKVNAPKHDYTRRLTMQRALRFTYAQSSLMFAALLALVLSNTLTLEFFFVVCFVIFVIVAELTALSTVTPQWRKRVWWFVALGVAGFGYIVIRTVFTILLPSLSF